MTKREAELDATIREQSKINFRAFYRNLKIDHPSDKKEGRLFENVAADFQNAFFEEIADSLETLRSGGMPKIKRAWLERTKKASKDADLAIIILWLVAFPTRPFFGQVGAGNRDQAGIVKDRISYLLEYNKWLNEYVEIIQNTVRSKKRLASNKPVAHVDILAADSEGSHGGTPDILLINELSHINKFDFAETLMDNADGVPNGMVIIATNAGFKGSKAEVWRNNAINSDNWCVHILDKPAPWHTKETLAEAKKRNPPSRYNRLWRGYWVSGHGDAVEEERIDNAFKLTGPISTPKKGCFYVGGLDVGVKHDHSGLFIMEIDSQAQVLRSAYWKGYAPNSETNEVDLGQVQLDCVNLNHVFHLQYLFYDPHQAVLLAQQLKKSGVRCVEVSFSVPSNLVAMANAFIQLLEAGKLELYDDGDCRLRHDLGKFDIVEKQYGHRLEAVSDEYGHADVGTAMVITLPFCLDALEGRAQWSGDEELVEVDDNPLSEKEIKEMDEGLRGIYEMDEHGGPKRSINFADDGHEDKDEDYFDELS